MSWPFNSPDSFDGGFWTGAPGSVDWCEENYVHSPYIAETTNTLSNLAYIILALYGVWNCRAQGLPTRFVLCNVFLLCVGCGSTAYHATLRRCTQGFDEVPMLYTVGVITYVALDTNPARARPHVLPAALLVAACAWTAAYTRIAAPVFLDFSFAALGLGTTLRVLLLLPQHARRVRVLYYQGFSVFMSGFLVWGLDSWYCAPLRAWRADVGWPATWLAQGHAYWHLATAVGAYRMIVASEVFWLGVDEYVVEGRWFPVVGRVRAKAG